MNAVAQQTVKATKTGWRADINLTFEAGLRNTIVRRTHFGPLSMQRPFYPEPDVCHVYLLHPPGGVVGGDELNISVAVKAGAAALITAPGAMKYYRSAGPQATQSQNFIVDGGTLEWLPQECIYFNECNAELTTNVHLLNNAIFIGWEIHCFGRALGDAPFKDGDVLNRLVLYRDGIPVVLDNLSVNHNSPLNQLSGMRSYSVYATMLVCDVKQDMLDVCRAILSPFDSFTVTFLQGVMLLRYLGNSGEVAKQGFVLVWTAVRPIVLGREACPPRIWLT